MYNRELIHTILSQILEASERIKGGFREFNHRTIF